MDNLAAVLLNLINETLTAAIVVISASLLLYNLSRNLRNRVARASGLVLAGVTAVYVGDVFISLQPTSGTLAAVVRLQWIGIAYMPAAMFHLSDALLATTGLPSRGRRRRVIQFLYLIGSVFLITAAFSDVLVRPIIVGNKLINVLGGPLFALYLIYFLAATSVAFINVQRARLRCLTRDTRRRMGYLQLAMFTPPLGVFPYSVLLGLSETGSVGMLLLVNLSNIIVILMLLFLAYPLSFFGTYLPDRMVKADLLRFMLRGPATALLALAAIIFTSRATQILGLPGNSFMPFAAVATVLLWQWFVSLVLPWLEKKLIYSGEDDDQLAKLQNLSERLLTRSDLLQLLDAILGSCCDYLQVNTAFAAAFTETEPEVIATVGSTKPHPQWLQDEADKLPALLQIDDATDDQSIQVWHSYWIVPLYSRRIIDETGEKALIGFVGIQARAETVNLSADEWQTFRGLVRRAAEALDDITLQTEIYGALEGLLPQIAVTRTRAAEIEYRPGHEPRFTAENGIDKEQFIEQVRAALRHYWGGPGLTGSRLLELKVVQAVLHENGDNAARALRAVLLEAIDRQKPDGERRMASPEWTIYNILDQRFIEKRKVREVAIRLAFSEADLYRKQRIAIEAVANTLLEMEAGQTSTPT